VGDSGSDGAEAAVRGARRFRVRGRVQGVGFRGHTREVARRLGLCGWVQNLASGEVEVWAEGCAEPLEELRLWLEKGPPAARVSAVEVASVPPAGCSGFEVRR
jgi:acylphosphatase